MYKWNQEERDVVAEMVERALPHHRTKHEAVASVMPKVLDLGINTTPGTVGAVHRGVFGKMSARVNGASVVAVRKNKNHRWTPEHEARPKASVETIFGDSVPGKGDEGWIMVCGVLRAHGVKVTAGAAHHRWHQLQPKPEPEPEPTPRRGPAQDAATEIVALMRSINANLAKIVEALT